MKRHISPVLSVLLAMLSHTALCTSSLTHNERRNLAYALPVLINYDKETNQGKALQKEEECNKCWMLALHDVKHKTGLTHPGYTYEDLGLDAVKKVHSESKWLIFSQDPPKAKHVIAATGTLLEALANRRYRERNTVLGDEAKSKKLEELLGEGFDSISSRSGTGSYKTFNNEQNRSCRLLLRSLKPFIERAKNSAQL